MATPRIPPSLRSSSSSSGPSQAAPAPIDRLSLLPPELLHTIFFLIRYNSLPASSEPSLVRPISKRLLPLQSAALYDSVHLTSWRRLEAFCETLWSRSSLGAFVHKLKVNPELESIEREERIEEQRRRTEVANAEQGGEGSEGLAEWSHDHPENEMQLDPRTSSPPQEFSKRFIELTTHALQSLTRLDHLSWVGTSSIPLHSLLFTPEFPLNCVPRLQQLRIVFPAGCDITSDDLVFLNHHPTLNTLAFILPLGPAGNEIDYPLATDHPRLENIKTVTIVGSFSNHRLIDLARCFTHAERVRWCPQPNDFDLIPFLHVLSTRVQDLTIVQQAAPPTAPEIFENQGRPHVVKTFDPSFAQFVHLRHLSIDAPAWLSPEFWESLQHLPLLETIVFEGEVAPAFADLKALMTSSNRRPPALKTLVLDQFISSLGGRLHPEDTQVIEAWFGVRHQFGPFLMSHAPPLPRGWVLPCWDPEVFGPNDAAALMALVGETGIMITGSIVDAIIVTTVFHLLAGYLSLGGEGPSLDPLEGESEEECYTRVGVGYLRGLLGETGWKLMQEVWFR